ncbi:MAG: hypothetical protein ABIJ21_00540 [Nanoarchaeota archaeon]
MAMRRKGVVFTIIVIILLAILIILANARSRHTIREKQDAQHAKIRQMNDFLTSFHADAKRAIHVSAFRALIGLEDYVSKQARLINDTEDYFVEIFYNGILQDDNTTFEIMNQSTFYDYQLKVDSIAQEINMNFTSDVTMINLSMSDPWTVKVDVGLIVTLFDQSDVAYFNYTTVVSAEVPIFDLRDPLYSVNTEGKLPVQVRRSPVPLFVNDTTDQNDTTYLQYHLNNSFYTNSSLAPSFIMRFENDLSPDPNGIESLVNLQVLADQGWVISTNNRSVVDYIYFGTEDYDSYCDIQNMIFIPDNWFILDKNHSDIYQVNDTLEHNDC